MAKWIKITADDQAAVERLTSFANKGHLVLDITDRMVELLSVIAEGPRGRKKEEVLALFNRQQLSALWRRGLIENNKETGGWRHTEIAVHFLAIAEVAGLVRQTRAPVMQLPVAKKRA